MKFEKRISVFITIIFLFFVGLHPIYATNMPIAQILTVVIIANVNMVGLAMVTKIVLLSWMKMENVQMTFVTKLNVKSEF